MTPAWRRRALKMSSGSWKALNTTNCSPALRNRSMSRKAAWIFGGFCGGGVLLLYFSDATGISPVGSPVLLFLLGGVAGAMAFLLLRDWALIVVTTLTGAVLITYQSRLGGPAGQALFVGLLLLGMFIQGNSLRGDRREKQKK